MNGIYLQMNGITENVIAAAGSIFMIERLSVLDLRL
jgi:hypothetical protein